MSRRAVYFRDPGILEEIKAESRRTGRSCSWLIRFAWKFAKAYWAKREAKA